MKLPHDQSGKHKFNRLISLLFHSSLYDARLLLMKSNFICKTLGDLIHVSHPFFDLGETSIKTIICEMVYYMPVFDDHRHESIYQKQFSIRIYPS